MSKKKLVYIFRQEGVDNDHFDIITKAVHRFFSITQLSKPKAWSWVKETAGWHRDVFKYDTGALIEKASLAWWIEEARRKSKKDRYLDSRTLYDCIRGDPWCIPEYPHFGLVVLNERICQEYTDSVELFAGVAWRGVGAAISVPETMATRYPRLTPMHPLELVTLHELGHIFGAPTNRGDVTVDVHAKFGVHCASTCVMFRGILEKIHIGEHLDKRPFCDLCLADMHAFLNPKDG